MQEVLLASLLILPLIFAGIVMIFCLKLSLFNRLRYPIDRYTTFNNKRIFGDNKTWFGVVMMMGVSSVSGYSLSLLYPQLSILGSSTYQIGVTYLFLGLSYSLGELPNSFVKRQLNIEPGTLPDNQFTLFFKLFDLLDGIFFVGCTMLFLYNVPLNIVFYAVVVGAMSHFVLHTFMITLRLKKAM